MEKQVEFFVSLQGEVCFYGHDGKVLSYSTEHPEIINHMAELISRLYPEAYKYLAGLYAKSKPNKLYFKFLISDRFIRCNLGSNDTLCFDVDGTILHLEKVDCPLRGICPRENIVCLPKLKTPFFPKELEVAKYFAQGYVAREIAEILGKSKNTVSAQLRKMTKRLGLQSTRDIIKVVHQLNL